LHYSYYYY